VAGADVSGAGFGTDRVLGLNQPRSAPPVMPTATVAEATAVPMAIARRRVEGTEADIDFLRA
jgi:hypothetical protein